MLNSLGTKLFVIFLTLSLATRDSIGMGNSRSSSSSSNIALGLYTVGILGTAAYLTFKKSAKNKNIPAKKQGQEQIYNHTATQAMWKALYDHDIKSLHAALENRADPNYLSDYTVGISMKNMTPLCWFLLTRYNSAHSQRDLAFVNMLLKYGADRLKTGSGRLAIHYAASHDVELVKLLLALNKEEQINCPDMFNFVCLFDAHFKPEIVSYLLENGADPFKTDILTKARNLQIDTEENISRNSIVWTEVALQLASKQLACLKASIKILENHCALKLQEAMKRLPVLDSFPNGLLPIVTSYI